MKKKVLLTSLAITISIAFLFSFSCVYAANSEVVDGIRNFVGGAENVVENKASGIAGSIRNVTSGMENKMDNIVDSNMNNEEQNNNSTMGGMTTNNGNNGKYTASRTSADYAEPTLAGMNMTTWTWIILLAAAVGIITLIWSYVTQSKNYNSYDE